MKYFCLPADFKYDTIDRYYEINGRYENSRVVETYGQLAPDTVFGSCRFPGNLPEVDRGALEKYIKYSMDKGIEFNYIINATCMGNEEVTRGGFKRIGEFLKMLRDIGAGWVTLSLPSLMEIARYAAPELKVKVSTVCQINSPVKAGFYEELGIKRIVLDEDIYRRFDILKNIRKVYSGDIEIILNSFCVNDCPYKMFHYNSFSHSHVHKDKYNYFSSRCSGIHIGADNYMKLNWIRPEDIHYYTGIGINYFKLQGRTNVFDGNPAKAVTHYIEEYYDGDLVSLLELFSDSKPLAIAQSAIDNRKLDGFFDRFVNDPGFCTKICSECSYCSGYADACISSFDKTIMEIMKPVYKTVMDEFPGILE